MLSSRPIKHCRLLITSVIRAGYLAVTNALVTAGYCAASVTRSPGIDASETPSPRGKYASLMCSRAKRLATVRNRTGLTSCGRMTIINARKGQMEGQKGEPCVKGFAVSTPEKIPQSLLHHRSAHLGNGPRQRNVLGANLHAILRIPAFLNAAIAHQCRQPLPLQLLARRMRIKQPHLRNRRRPHESRIFVELRASLHAASARNAPRKRISLLLLLWRYSRSRPQVIGPVNRNPSLHRLTILKDHATVRRQIANDWEL